MELLVWATSFSADLWSLTRRIAAEPDLQVKVVLDDPSHYLEQPVAALEPLPFELIRRRRHYGFLRPGSLRADVLVFDNHLPFVPHAPRGFALWHGLGWRGPNDVHEFRWLHRNIRLLWGSGRRPNPRFRWACYGPPDLEHRTQVSGFAPDNCRTVGAASHDDLRTPLDRSRVADAYPFDVVGRKTVLIAPTWHYGSLFGHWGDEAEILGGVLDRIEDLGANVVFRLHDRFRMPPAYQELVARVVEPRRNVMVKYKDEYPDNYVDMQIADVLVTNFSSLANLFYATGRPTVHVYPVRDADAPHRWRTLGMRGVQEHEVDSARALWKFPLEDNGGLLARDRDQLLAQLEQALLDPHCTDARARDYLDRHMMGADGRSCARIIDALRAMMD